MLPYYSFWFVHDATLLLQNLTCLERLLAYRDLEEQVRVCEFRA